MFHSRDLPYGGPIDPAYWAEDGGYFTVGTSSLTTKVFKPNGSNAYEGYYRVGNGARMKWTGFYGRRVRLVCYATQLGNNSRPAIRVYDSGATYARDYWCNAPLQYGLNVYEFILPPDANKTIELLVPAQHATAASAEPKGNYPVEIWFDQPATISSPASPANKLVIYGDSITSGGNGICSSNLGFAGLLKKGSSFSGYNGSVTQVSYGYRKLADDVNSVGTASAFAAVLATTLAAKQLVIFIGSNDQAVIPATPVATFQTYYGYLMDALKSANVNLEVFCVSPLLRGTETANYLGDTMGDFRTAISTVVAAQSGWTTAPTYVDGSSLLAFADLDSDKTHPDTDGNATLAAAILALL